MGTSIRKAALRNLIVNNIVLFHGDPTNQINKPRDSRIIVKEMRGSMKDWKAHLNRVNLSVNILGSPAVIKALLAAGQTAVDVKTPFYFDRIWSIPVSQSAQRILNLTKDWAPEETWSMIIRDPIVAKFIQFATGADSPQDYNLIILSLFDVLKRHHPESGYHSEGVSSINKAICRTLGMSEDETEKSGRGGLLHDIGKIGVSTEILKKKPEKFTDADYKRVQTHVKMGWSLLKACGLNDIILNSKLYHHLPMGYPEGIDFDHPPLEGMICAAADSFEAGVAGRIYNKPKLHTVVLGEMEKPLTEYPYNPKILAALKKALKKDKALIPYLSFK